MLNKKNQMDVQYHLPPLALYLVQHKQVHGSIMHRFSFVPSSLKDIFFASYLMRNICDTYVMRFENDFIQQIIAYSNEYLSFEQFTVEKLLTMKWERKVLNVGTHFQSSLRKKTVISYVKCFQGKLISAPELA